MSYAFSTSINTQRSSFYALVYFFVSILKANRAFVALFLTQNTLLLIDLLFISQSSFYSSFLYLYCVAHQLGPSTTLVGHFMAFFHKIDIQNSRFHSFCKVHYYHMLFFIALIDSLLTTFSPLLFSSSTCPLRYAPISALSFSDILSITSSSSLKNYRFLSSCIPHALTIYAISPSLLFLF